MVALFRRWFSLVASVRAHVGFRQEHWVEPWNEITRQVEASLLALPAPARATVIAPAKTAPALAAPITAADAVIEGEAVAVEVEPWPPEEALEATPTAAPRAPGADAAAADGQSRKKRRRGSRRAA